MDRRNFLKTTGITLAGLIAAGMVLPAVAKAVETIPKVPEQPQHPFPYGHEQPIEWELYQNDHVWRAIVHGYDRDTYELKFCPVAVPEAELDIYGTGNIEAVKYRVAAQGAQMLEDDNCIVLTKY